LKKDAGFLNEASIYKRQRQALYAVCYAKTERIRLFITAKMKKTPKGIKIPPDAVTERNEQGSLFSVLTRKL
jgi:hypothetical protein